MSALSQKKKLVRQQAILIQHALMCTDHCTLPFCEDMKAALTHMAKCQPGIQCPVKHCASSWAIYTHAKNCKKPVCAVCEPFSSRINDSKIENVTERSIELWMEVVGMRAQSLNASTVERAVNTTMDVSVLEASVIDLPVTQTTNTMKENEEPTAMTVLNAKSDGQRAMEAQTAHNGENSTEKSTQGSTNEMFSGQPEESLTGKGPTRRKSSSGRLSLQKSTKSKTTEKKPTEKKSIETKTAEKNVVEKKPTKKRTSEKKAAEKKPTKRRSSVVSTQADSTKEKSTENNSAAMEPTTEPTEEESTNNISLDMPTIEEEPTTLFFTTAMEANSILGGALNTTEMNMTASNASFSQTNLVQSTPMFKKPNASATIAPLGKGQKQTATIQLKLGPGLNTNVVIPLPALAKWTTSTLADAISYEINKSVASNLFKVAQSTKDGIIVFEQQYRACMKAKNRVNEKRKANENEQREKKRSRQN